MKIVCEACQAKYSISDDKVQGKVFKIRCKKCSNVIVVRGGAGGVEPAATEARSSQQADDAPAKDTRVYDYDAGGGQATVGEDAVWHLVIQQEQVGPMTAADVEQRFAAGEIDAETFVWREGFADWTPLSQVDTFAGLAAGATAATGSSTGAGAAAIGAMFGGMDHTAAAPSNDVSDLFAPPTAASAPGPAPADDDGSDLFAPTPAAATAAATAHKLRGERNENSVLFSLNNLAQLASDRPASAAALPSGLGSGVASPATGSASGEGSGLIDIRSMASAYLGSSAGAGSKPATSSAIGSIDDLPVFGAGGFSEPAVMMPTVQRTANNKFLYVMISAVGLLALMAIVMVVVLLKGGKQTVVVAEGAAKPVSDTKSGADTRPGTDTKPSDTTSTKADLAGAEKPDGKSDPVNGSDVPKPDPDASSQAADPGAKKPESTKKPPPRSGGSTTKPSGTATATGSKPDTTTKPDTTAAKPDSGGGGSCDEVSCVLNNYEGACCSKFRKSGGSRSGGGATKPAGGGDVPDALDRAMISSGIAAVKARVTACGDRSAAKGKVKVHVKVGSDGRVSNVSVETTPDPALGSCVAAAVQRASFAKTGSGGSFSYPFVF